MRNASAHRAQYLRHAPIRRRPRTDLEKLEPRQLLAAALNAWSITGTSAANAILIDYKPSDPSRLRAWIDGKVVSTRSIKGLDLISVLGGAGNDRIVFNLPDTSSNPHLQVWANGQAGKDKLVGGAESNTFLGGSNRDTLIGGPGNDSLKGGTGNDDCLGDDGNDYLQGNAGNDTLSGGWGNDKLTGAAGNDQLRGGGNADNLSGGQGRDAVKGGDKADYIDGGAAPDTLFSQTAIDDVITYADDTTAPDVVDSSLDRLESEAALRNWIIEQSVKQWKDFFGKQAGLVYAYDRGMVVAGSNFNAVSAQLDADAPDASTTNTQTLGVDEADIVETDGNFLYLIRNDELVIIDARPAKDMKVVSRTKFEGRALGMYLSGGRLALVSQLGGYPSGIAFRSDPASLTADAEFQLPDYKLPQGRVTVFDVSTPSAPTVAQTTDFDGTINDSRVIDGRLYLVMQNYLNAPSPDIVKDAKGNDIYETEAQFRARLATIDLTGTLARYAGTSADGTKTAGSVISPPDLYARSGERMDVSSVVLIDMNSSVARPLASTSIIGAAGTIYASRDNLYLAGNDWNNSSGDTTTLVKFGLGPDSITLEATGDVEGTLLNQYSMDENGRYFRLATTTGWGTGSASSVWSLDQVGDELSVIGHVDGLGVGERIFAARFVGDRAYLITYQQIDPLFTLDMSNPTDPRVVGELKMPGVSQYLHPIDANHLLGVGFDENSDLAVSLFDVTDPAHPKQTAAYSFTADYSDSPVVNDPHAFAYFADQHTLALPLMRGKMGKETQLLALINVDVAGTLSLAGEITHTAAVQRSVRIGSDIYSIGEDGVRAHSLTNLPTELAFLDLPSDSIGNVFPVFTGVMLI